MTIMVKTNIRVHKQGRDVTVTRTPLINAEDPQAAVNTASKVTVTRYKRKGQLRPVGATSLSLKYLMLTGLLLVGLGFVLGMVVFADMLDRIAKSKQLNYSGTCAISTTDNSDYVVVHASPPGWWGAGASGEMRVYSAGSALIAARALRGLLERVSVEGARESVAVRAGARGYSLLHDFNDNFTNIISPERCFLMEMVREFVLEPASLVASFRNESALELSHAHSVYRAQLPPARLAPGPAPPAAGACLADGKPVYRLSLEGTHVLRKRSVEVVRSTEPPTTATPTEADFPSNDFVHFSGNHLQRITISNLDDVVRYEEDKKALRAHPKLGAAAAVAASADVAAANE